MQARRFLLTRAAQVAGRLPLFAGDHENAAALSSGPVGASLYEEALELAAEVPLETLPDRLKTYLADWAFGAINGRPALVLRVGLPFVCQLLRV